MSRTVFVLRPAPPFRLDLTVWALRRRPNNAVDRWDGQTYRRVVPLVRGAVDVAVRQIKPPDTPELQVTVTGRPFGPTEKTVVTAALERLLGFRIDLAKFHQFASCQAKLGPLVARFRGMKPPRYATLFECLVNAIACQQISLTVGLVILNRLAERYGPAVEEAYGFPRPDDLSELRSKDLRQLGFSEHKARAVIELANGVSRGHLDLEGLALLPDQEAVAQLRQLRGVGRWTAEYVLLRGLGRWHIFPGDDVGARSALQRWRHSRKALDYDAVKRILRRWRPYTGLVYLHLLLNGLDEAGYLS